MSKGLTIPNQADMQAATHLNFDSKQIEILKSSICKGASNEEFEIFLMACKKTQLDPFMKQIYAVKRKARKPDGTWGETMTIQTGIDGYRLIAERTGCYAPGPEPTYACDDKGKLLSATAYIKKMTRDGTWHTVSASAYLDEYAQKKSDGSALGMWGTMPRTMLAKCAESQALRKAFPAEMSGVYTKEEMAQADVEFTTPITPVIPPIEAKMSDKQANIAAKMSDEQANELALVLMQCDEKYNTWVYNHIRKVYKTDDLRNLPADIFERMKSAAIKYREARLPQKRVSVDAAERPLQPELILQEVR